MTNNLYTCPECGQDLEKHGTILICHSCGFNGCVECANSDCPKLVGLNNNNESRTGLKDDSN